MIGFDQLLSLCDTTRESVQLILANKSAHYDVFKRRKRSGGIRVISEPHKELKAIQRKILHAVLYDVRVHPNAFGFFPKRSVYQNAQKHVNKRVIYTTDIQDFFPNISQVRIAGLLVKIGYNKPVSNLVADLCTFNNCLPQGAPTSPHISNILCFRLDKRLTGLAKSLNLQYSRYADDITFSGETIHQSFTFLLQKIIRQEGFRVNKNKTRVLGQGNRQIVTGLVVNQKKTWGRKNYKLLKSELYRLATRKDLLGEDSIDSKKRSLMGKISMYRKVDALKWYYLRLMFEKIDWSNHLSKQGGDTKEIDILDGIRLKLETINLLFPDSFAIRKSVFKSARQPCDSIQALNYFVQRIFLIVEHSKPLHFFKSLSEASRNRLSNRFDKQVIVFTNFLMEHKLMVEDGSLNVFRNLSVLSSGLARHENDRLQERVSQALEFYSFNSQDENFSEVRDAILNHLSCTLDAIMDFLSPPLAY